MTAMTDEQLGSRLKDLREASGMAQEELADALGVDQSTVSRIERGQRAVTARELALASGALHVTLGEIVDSASQAPALLREGDADSEGARGSLELFNRCIDEYRGVEALAR
jgi:transcriptional regulator with XRE-family HTH domain